MQSYLSSGEGYTLKCSEQELINNLIEMYTYHYKQACLMHDELFGDNFLEEEQKIEELDNMYKLGKYDGAVEALSAILLSVIGGGNMYDLWQQTMEWANR